MATTSKTSRIELEAKQIEDQKNLLYNTSRKKIN